ncbi:MAG: hypothetical protein IPP66_10915 [Anaerolineales bacterium]|nr:hypothetical protein [Anaerolineales bacterium]
MTDIFRTLLIVLLLTVSLAAYFVTLGALFPSRVAKVGQVINQIPGRSLGVGFVNFLFFGVILLVLVTITDGNANRVDSVIRAILLVPTIGLAGLLTAVLSFGLVGMVNVLGEKVFPTFEALKRTISGSVLLSFACALPFVGWFLLFPYVALTGFGAVILSFFQKNQ